MGEPAPVFENKRIYHPIKLKVYQQAVADAVDRSKDEGSASPHQNSGCEYGENIEKSENALYAPGYINNGGDEKRIQSTLDIGQPDKSMEKPEADTIGNRGGIEKANNIVEGYQRLSRGRNFPGYLNHDIGTHEYGYNGYSKDHEPFNLGPQIGFTFMGRTAAFHDRKLATKAM
jgi:hypothetical protein